MDGFIIALIIILFGGIVLYLRKAEQAEHGDTGSGGRDYTGDGGRDRDREDGPGPISPE